MRMLARLTLCAAAVVMCNALPVVAQTKATAENVPIIPHKAVPNFFKLPPDLYFGEGIGIAVKRGNDTLRQAFNWALFRIWEKGRFSDLWLRYFPISPF